MKLPHGPATREKGKLTPTPDLHRNVLRGTIPGSQSADSLNVVPPPPLGNGETERGPSPQWDGGLLHSQHGGNSRTSHSVKGAGHRGHAARSAPRPLCGISRKVGVLVTLWWLSGAAGERDSRMGTEGLAWGQKHSETDLRSHHLAITKNHCTAH